MAKEKFATSELNFTYYLGAGASKEALPIVNNISASFLSLSEALGKNPNIEPKYNEAKIFYVKQLKEMAEQSNAFGTIDTYMKFLFLKKFEKFLEAKQALSFFFYYQQAFIQNRDKRALIFLTSVIQYSMMFPTNINFISWNYDFQIELAAETFISEKLTSHPNGSTHSPPLITYYPSSAPFSEDSAQLVHLNGIAGMYADNQGNRYSHFLNPPIGINGLFKIFPKEYDISLISFAWEHDNNLEGALLEPKFNLASATMLKTDILIIIGYSFPYFNRVVDSLMFSRFIENGRKKTIYFQNPFLDGSFLRNQFSIPEEIKILPIKEVENYYIPKEL